MAEERPLFVDIPYDTWVEIACLMLPSDICAFERTCKNARKLFEERHVWLSILKNMVSYLSPNVPLFRPLHSLSLREVRRIATHADNAHRTWTYADVITHSQKTIIPLPQLKACPAFVIPVSGTPFVVVYSDDVGLMLVNVQTGSCVWMGQPALSHLNRVETEVQVATFMKTPDILLICTCSSNHIHLISCIEVQEVNVNDGRSTILSYNATGAEKTCWRIRAARMCGNTAIAVGGTRLAIVNCENGMMREINVIYPILAVQLTNASIFIISIDDKDTSCLSVVPISAIWASQQHPTDVTVLWEMDTSKVLHIPLRSEYPLWDGVKISVYEKDKLDGTERIHPEVVLNILHCFPSDERPELLYNTWKIDIIELSHDTESPYLVSQVFACGKFVSGSTAPSRYASIRVSRLTRSGRFVVSAQDAQSHRYFYASSCARIAAGDPRLIPIEIPCDDEPMNVKRISVDEYSGEIYWICYSLIGLISTRYN